MMRLARMLQALRQRSQTRDGAGPIGLDLGYDGLHLAQMQRKGSNLSIRTAASAPYAIDRSTTLGSSNELRSLLRQAMRGRPFKGRRVATAMPADELKLMVLNYELDRSRSEVDVILNLVKERIEPPLDQWVIDYMSIRLSGAEHGHKSALVAVAKREVVIQRLELLRQAGLDVTSLEIAPMAIRRLAIWLSENDTAENTLVVHCGRTRSDLTVLWGRRLILYREIGFCEEALVAELCKSLDVSPESASAILNGYGVLPKQDFERSEDVPGVVADDATVTDTVAEILNPSFHQLADAINKAVLYTASQTRGASIDSVRLIGSIVNWPGADQLLAELLSIPVRLLDPLDRWRQGGRGAIQCDPQSGVAIAVGLGLREVEDE